MRRHRQIALLGFPGVGKSSLAHHFVYKQFVKDYDPNIRTDLRHQCVIGGQEYDLVIVDNAGSDQYTLNHGDFENSDAYILVYAIDDQQSFTMVSKIRDKIMSTSANTRIPLVLVGNKIDRKDERVVQTDDGRALAHEWHVHFVEASAMDFNAVQDIFTKSIYAMEHTDLMDEKSVNDRVDNPSSVPVCGRVPSQPNGVGPHGRHKDRLNGNCNIS